MSGSWYDSARGHIREVDAKLPLGIAFEDRKKAIQAAYPWGERAPWPYKMWLKAQREYLLKFVTPDNDSRQFPLSPLERAMQRSKAISQSSGPLTPPSEPQTPAEQAASCPATPDEVPPPVQASSGPNSGGAR